MTSKFRITDEDVEQILMKAEGQEHTYSSNEIIPFTEGRSGILGEHYKLKIRFKETPDELRFFLKRIPSRYYANRKEEGFYGTILPEYLKYKIEDISSILPHCYYIKNFDYVVLEDLTVCGYKTMNPRTPLNKDYILCALKSLAKYHGASIIYEIKRMEDLGKEFDMIQCFTEELKEIYYCKYPVEKDVLQAVKNTIESQVTLFENIVCKNISKDYLVSSLVSLWDTMKDYVKPSKKYKNVVCHGDLWQANLMFSFKNDSPEKCVLIDEQMIRWAPPAQDVMGFLYLTTDRKFRETHLNSMLDCYYNYLQELLFKYDINCESLIPRQEFLHSCDTYKVFAMLQAFNYSHITHIPTESFEKYMGEKGEKMKFLFESRSKALERFCKEDQIYKERQLECLLDLVEYVEGQETKV